MPIVQLTTDVAGQIEVNPRIIKMIVTDSLATITTAGYLNNEALSLGYTFLPTDIFNVWFDYVDQNDPGTLAIFTVTESSGVLTLVEWGNPGEVVLPTIANHMAVYTDTVGTISKDAATAINGGNIQAGLSGTAGTLASFPATGSKGSLKVVAVANTGNTDTTISNAAMGQASVISIPDPATATANFVVRPAALVSNNLIKASGTAGLVVDAGARIISNTTAAYAGGGTSNTFAATGLTVAAKGSAVIRASTNSVSITKALPGTDTLAITFSADPGANTTVDYIYTTASQA